MGRRHESSGFGVVLVAAAAGFAAGILFAPKSGAETRKDVRRKTKEYQQQANHGLDVAKGTVEAGRKELKTVANEVAQDARELSADAKVRAKRTGEHAKTGAQNVSSNAREAWSNRSQSSPRQ